MKKSISYKQVLEKRAATNPNAANLGWKSPAATKEQQIDQLKAWAKDIATDARGAGLYGAAGTAGLYLLSKVLRGKRPSILGTLGWGLAGFGGGALGKSIYSLLQGRPYNRTYDTSNIKPGQNVYIGVSGAGDGPDSELDTGLRNAVGEGNYAMFRHGDTDKMVQFVNTLPENVNPIIISHSWGGSSTQQAAPGIKHKSVQFHTIDPVGHIGKWTGQRGKGTVYVPNNRSVDYDGTNAISYIGGQWTDPKFDQTVTYNGGHSKGVQALVEQIASR